MRDFFKTIVNSKFTAPIIYGTPILLLVALFAIAWSISSAPRYAILIFINNSGQNIADIRLSNDHPFASLKDLKANTRKQLKFEFDRTTFLDVTVRFNNGTMLKAKDIIYLMRPFDLHEQIIIYKDKILLDSRDQSSAANPPKGK